MVRLAESITGVHTVSENQPDPEYLNSIEDAKKIAGIPLKLPTKLPGGYELLLCPGSERRNDRKK